MIGSCICPVLAGSVVHSNDCWLSPRQISEPCQSCADLTARVTALEESLANLLDVCQYVGPEDNPFLSRAWDKAKKGASHLLTPRATTEGA